MSLDWMPRTNRESRAPFCEMAVVRKARLPAALIQGLTVQGRESRLDALPIGKVLTRHKGVPRQSSTQPEDMLLEGLGALFFRRNQRLG
jgi:hypothetical protein